MALPYGGGSWAPRFAGFGLVRKPLQVKKNTAPARKPLLLLVGGGETGRALAARLSGKWDVSLIEQCGELDLAGLEQVTQVHRGDATSSLVLRAAGAERARAVVAAAGKDIVNLEVCRLCNQLFGVANRLAVVSESERLEEFAKEGVSVIHRGSSLALSAETHLDRGTRAASNVGLGQGEICEVEVLPRSSAIGKTPRLLNPQSWLLAAIFRDHKLIVPHGDTVICEGDTVLLVGQPEILAGIANYFRAGTSEFPLQYGAKIIGLARHGEDPDLLDEVAYLYQNSEATGYVVMTPGQRPESVPEETHGATLSDDRVFEPKHMSKALDELDSGCSVVPAPPRRWYHSFGLDGHALLRLLEAHTEPVIISRGTFPYKRIALGVQPGTAARFAAEMAVDFARGMGCELTAIAAVPSPFLYGDEYQKELEAAVAGVASLGELYGLEVDTRVVTGNPVHKLLELSKEYDLIVVAHRVGIRSSMMNPDISRHLILRSHCSVLCLPHALETSSRRQP